jgi:hypothetical protein
MLLVACMLLASCDDVLPPGPPEDDEWFPLAMGNTWIYRLRKDPLAPLDSALRDTVKIIGHETVDSTVWYRSQDRYYLKRRDGFYFVENRAIATSPVRLLAFPLEVGDTISRSMDYMSPFVFDSARAIYHVRILRGLDTVITVPAGTFHCLTVETYTSSPMPILYDNLVTYDYYAWHIGRVKSENLVWRGIAFTTYDNVEELIAFRLH